MTAIGAALAAIFREAVDADYFESTWFKDNDPGGSFIPSLDQLSSAQASEIPACGRNSAAAHAGHISFAFAALLHYLHFHVWEKNLDWESSWGIQEVDDDAWTELRGRLRRQAAEIHAHLQLIPAESEQDTLTGSVAFVAHCAYHLGAVRQIAANHLQHGR